SNEKGRPSRRIFLRAQAARGAPVARASGLARSFSRAWAYPRTVLPGSLLDILRLGGELRQDGLADLLPGVGIGDVILHGVHAGVDQRPVLSRGLGPDLLL